MPKCSECGKNLGILNGYYHPVEGKEKIVCGSCWDKINYSENKYTSFISDSINKKGIGFICFILIKVKPTFEMETYNKIKNLPEIIEIHPLMGMYDFIVKLRAENNNKLGEYIINNIRKINGINYTNTLTGAFSLSGIKE